MLKLNLIIGCEFDVIFFIASFHHIEDIDNRFLTLLFADRLLRENGMIFMTNWALKSDLNREKYKNFEIPDSTNKF
ncbi:MAG: hypothetical protein LBU14_03915 [Candidatus Peribacteria bacterium]|jgi:hypothetical protein|nr:hypothetical protein [Candidatus Peribacteria bacterium]